MAILLVRHGETALNAARVVQPPETPLNETGQGQARLLAERLRALPLGAILCSDLPRARMTAAPLVELTGLAPRFSAELQERNFGELRGTAYADLTEDIFAPGYQPPGGESWSRFHERTARAWQLVVQAARESAGDLVVVTHGFVCRSLAERVLRFAPDQPAPLRFGNTSVTVVEHEPPHRVRLANCTAHLDATHTDDARSPSGI